MHDLGHVHGSLRYALDILIEAGAVIRHGGQGERSTTYEWNTEWRTGPS